MNFVWIIAEPHRPFPIPASFDEDKLRLIELPPNYPDVPLIRRDCYASNSDWSVSSILLPPC